MMASRSDHAAVSDVTPSRVQPSCPRRQASVSHVAPVTTSVTENRLEVASAIAVAMPTPAVMADTESNPRPSGFPSHTNARPPHRAASTAKHKPAWPARKCAAANADAIAAVDKDAEAGTSMLRNLLREP